MFVKRNIKNLTNLVEHLHHETRDIDNVITIYFHISYCTPPQHCWFAFALVIVVLKFGCKGIGETETMLLLTLSLSPRVQQPTFDEKWKLMVVFEAGSIKLHATSWEPSLHHYKLRSCLYHRCILYSGQKNKKHIFRDQRFFTLSFVVLQSIHNYNIIHFHLH